MSTRRSYRGLSLMPAWLLYDGDKVVASVRAVKAEDARELFKRAGLKGTHVRRSYEDRRGP